MRLIRRIWHGLKLRRDLVFPLIMCVMSIAGTVMAFVAVQPPQYLLAVVFGLLGMIAMSWAAVPYLSSYALPFSRVWLSMKGARRWLKGQLGREHSLLRDWGVRDVYVIGVACTDIAYLFEEVVSELKQGVSFHIVMVDPSNPDVLPNGAITKWETPKDVRTFVQEPLAEHLREMAKTYREESGRQDLSNVLLRLANQLEDDHLVSHSTCIEVSAALWKLAEEEAHMRETQCGAHVSIYYVDYLPFARQWLIGRKILLYSMYVGHPGVGIDNPVFGYTVPPEKGAILERATYFCTEMVSKLAKKACPASPRSGLLTHGAQHPEDLELAEGEAGSA